MGQTVNFRAGERDQTIKMDKLFRDARIDRAAVDATRRTVHISFSSETDQVVRWAPGIGNYVEVLDHTPTSVDLTRLNRGGGILLDHNPTDQVGVIERATVGADRKGRADVRFGKSARATEIFQDVTDEIRQNVSFGYEVYDMVLQEEEKGDLPVYRAMKWMPFEISFVSIPADISVGVGRSEGEAWEFKIMVPDKTNKEERTMQDPAVAPALAPAAPVVRSSDQTDPKPLSGKEMEEKRKRGITNLCKMNNLGDNYREMWIGQGLDMNQVSDEILLVLEERGKTNPMPASRLGLTGRETKQFSLSRAIVACIDKDWKNAGFELECSRAVAAKINKPVEPNRFFLPFEVMERPVIQQRDLLVATAGAGGYLVSTENIGFIEMLRNRSVVMRMGARRLSGLTGNVTVPRQSAAATGYWLATEGTAITESQQTFVQMALTPKTVGAYTEISRQLLLQSSPGAEGIVTDDLAQVVAIAADLGALEGTSSGGQPAGLAGTSGVGSVTGTSLAAAGIIEFQSDVASANVAPLSFGYVTTPAVAGLLMVRPELPTTGTTRLWQGNIWNGTMFDLPAMSTNQLTAATMIAGDWQELVLAEWGVLEVEVNPYANFPAGIVGVRAIYSMDIGVRRPFAFSRATSIT